MEENEKVVFTPQPEPEPVNLELTSETTGIEVQSETAPDVTKPKSTRKPTPQLSEDEMVEIITKFKASGLTRRAFCLENNYGLSSLYYWQKKYDALYPEEKAKDAGIPKLKAEKKEKAVKVKKEAKTKKETKTKATKPKRVATPKVKADEVIAAPIEVIEPPKPKTKAVKQKNEPVAVTEAGTSKRRGRPKGSKNKSTLEKLASKAKPAATKEKVTPVSEKTDDKPAVEARKKPGRPAKAKTKVKAKAVPAKSTAPKAAPKADVAVPVVTPDVTPVVAGTKRGRKKAEAAPAVAPATVMQIKYPNGVRINVTADISIERLKELISL